jgi:hypothetical protein
MTPDLSDAICDAARKRGMTVSAWLREAARTMATLEGTLPPIISRDAGELYDRDPDGRQRWARIEGDQIKGIRYHAAKPDDGNVWVPVEAAKCPGVPFESIRRMITRGTGCHCAAYLIATEKA